MSEMERQAAERRLLALEVEAERYGYSRLPVNDRYWGDGVREYEWLYVQHDDGTGRFSYAFRSFDQPACAIDQYQALELIARRPVTVREDREYADI